MGMETRERTRSCCRDRISPAQVTPRGSKQVCVPMNRDLYDRIWEDCRQVRRFLEPLVQSSPELFPEGMHKGFQLTGRLPESAKMPGVRLRQIRLRDGRVFTLRPSFVISYMMGAVEEREHPLLLLAFGVPCWLVTQIFGRNAMHWQRQLQRLGCNSLAGTTRLGGTGVSPVLGCCLRQDNGLVCKHGRGNPQA